MDRVRRDPGAATEDEAEAVTVGTLNGRRSYLGKRGLDLVVVCVAALPAAVIGALCALCVKFTGRGPVLFRQERIGLGGEPFELLKFRTMVAGDNPLYPDPSRITRVGAFLRRTSLDELPELINVVRGEMSIVGPRPTLAYQVARYDERQRMRLAVRPGLTGLAQVEGRNALQWAQRIEIDIRYVETQSLWLDVRIMLRSVLTVLRGSGVEGHPLNDPIARPPGE